GRRSATRGRACARSTSSEVAGEGGGPPRRWPAIQTAPSADRPSVASRMTGRSGNFTGVGADGRPGASPIQAHSGLSRTLAGSIGPGAQLAFEIQVRATRQLAADVLDELGPALIALGRLLRDHLLDEVLQVRRETSALELG